MVDLNTGSRGGSTGSSADPDPNQSITTIEGVPDTVEDDAVDVTAIIGDGKTGEGEFEDRVDLAETDGNDVEFWEIIDAEVSVSINTSPDWVQMVITPSDGVEFPAQPDREYDPTINTSIGVRSPDGYLGREFTLDVDTELRANTPGPETTRLFTGRIANMTSIGNFAYKAVVYDKSQENFIRSAEGAGQNTDLMNSKVLLNLSDPTITEDAENSYYNNRAAAGNTNIRASELIDTILEKAGIPEENRTINLYIGGRKIGEHPEFGYTVRRGYNRLLSFSEDYKLVKDVLKRITESCQAIWYFDRWGEFHFEAPVPNENIIAYNLVYVTDASDGQATPPYRSVKVIGSGVVSTDGWDKASLLSEAPAVQKGSVSLDPSDDALVEPTFVYRNLEINTQSEAESVANDLIEDFKSQRAEGTVTVVGFPEIRPNDTIQMPQASDPDSDNFQAGKPMSQARYGVEKVVHRLNSSDGFITKLTVRDTKSSQDIIYAADGQLESIEQELINDWRNEFRSRLVGDKKARNIGFAEAQDEDYTPALVSQSNSPNTSGPSRPNDAGGPRS